MSPDSVEEYAEAARRLLDDSYLRKKTAEAGARHVRRFSAENFAKATMAVYNKAILDFCL